MFPGKRSSCLWIWSTEACTWISLIVQTSPIISFSWIFDSQLVILTEASDNIYFWCASGCKSIPVPPHVNFSSEPKIKISSIDIQERKFLLLDFYHRIFKTAVDYTPQYQNENEEF